VPDSLLLIPSQSLHLAVLTKILNLNSVVVSMILYAHLYPKDVLFNTADNPIALCCLEMHHLLLTTRAPTGRYTHSQAVLFLLTVITQPPKQLLSFHSTRTQPILVISILLLMEQTTRHLSLLGPCLPLAYSASIPTSQHWTSLVLEMALMQQFKLSVRLLPLVSKLCQVKLSKLTNILCHSVNGGDGLLYQCADVTLSSSVDFR
jgi:hypothetical protein